MNSTEHGGTDAAHRGFRGFIEWLEEKLEPALGAPMVGPYGPIVDRVGVAVCPVCARPMVEHTIEHDRPNAILHCPIDHPSPPRDDRPLNEVGMPRRDR